MRYSVTYDEARCTGCLRCQLACSRAHARCFQLSAARIHIEIGKQQYRARFTGNCLECGLCADSCLSDALKKRPKKAAA